MLNGFECVWWTKSYYSVGQNWQVADFLLLTSQLWAPAQPEGQLVDSTQGWPVWSRVLCLAPEVCPSIYFQRQPSHTSGSKDPLAYELHTRPCPASACYPSLGQGLLSIYFAVGKKNCVLSLIWT